MNFGSFFRERRFYESKLAIKGYRLLRRAASRVGFQVVLKTFYSPIPNLSELPADVFERRSALAGLSWDLDAQLRFLAHHADAMAEFRPPSTAEEGIRDQYVVANPSYGLLDATVLYGVIRSLTPRRVIELGSGHSTLVIAQAGRANLMDGQPLTLEAFDPYPSVVSEGLSGLDQLHPVAAQDVPMATFERLEAGDVLVIDTTHTVKIGSDVNHVVLEVLPRLARGVIVHVHDIFLPHEYPRRWPQDFGLYWNEQYLIQAFLTMNPHYDVLCAVAALRRDRGSELARVVTPFVADAEGSALWMRRV